MNSHANRLVGCVAGAAIVALVVAILFTLAGPAGAANVITQDDANYLAFEAEDFFALTDDDWRVVTTAGSVTSPVGVTVLPATTNASGGTALLNDFGQGETSLATYRLHFDAAGDYRMYVRYSMFESNSSTPLGDAGQNYGNEDSFHRPTTLNGTPNTIQAGFSSANAEGTFGWYNTGTEYSVTGSHLVAQSANLDIRPRETGFAVDRIILSTNASLTTTQLEALSNSSNTGPVVYYGFEAPDTTADNLATDNSFNGRDGNLVSIGEGSFSYVNDAPTALSHSNQSLLLVENSTGGGDPPHNAANLNYQFSTSELDINNDSWTFSGWFNRDVDTDVDKGSDDFILHMGGGDGFGGGNELYVYASGENSLALHNQYDPNGESEDPSSVRNVDIATSDVARGEWHHVAVLHDADSGEMSLFLDGGLVGTDSDFALNLSQTASVIFGGHTASAFRTERWFDGMLDDIALWNRALSVDDIAALADGTYDLPTNAVPEPGTFAMLVAGLLGFALYLRRRRR